MTKIFKIGLVVMMLGLVMTPALALTLDHIVPDCGPCSFNDLVRKGGLIDNIIQFLTFVVAVPLTTLFILYGGVQMVISSANPGAYDRGKKIISAAILGLVFTLAGYLIIKSIIVFSVDSSSPVGARLLEIFK